MKNEQKNCAKSMKNPLKKRSRKLMRKRRAPCNRNWSQPWPRGQPNINKTPPEETYKSKKTKEGDQHFANKLLMCIICSTEGILLR